jgi:hypothetical protein
MAYLVDELSSTKAEINGEWVIARPYVSGIGRFRDAWMVLIGRYDAVRYLGNQ